MRSESVPFPKTNDEIKTAAPATPATPKRQRSELPGAAAAAGEICANNLPLQTTTRTTPRMKAQQRRRRHLMANIFTIDFHAALLRRDNATDGKYW